jgi:hypothetical protein
VPPTVHSVGIWQWLGALSGTTDLNNERLRSQGKLNDLVDALAALDAAACFRIVGVIERRSTFVGPNA